MINITDVWKGFGLNKVLKGVNLNIEKGETMVIIGRSGCGKSILLKHIIGLMKPERGKIEVFGQDITRMNEQSMQAIRKRFGMLFQGAALFDSLNVAENVGFFLFEHTNMKKNEIMGIVSEKLKLVALSGVEYLSPSDLSGGMRKRVGLARAIAASPEIILYDEPTTGLDPILAANINKLIKELQNKLSLTSIVVTHDMTSAYAIADRIAMLYDGKIIEVGTPEEIKNTRNPVVQQFIAGNAEGPIISD
ncbi:ABC transporter ATP-binding protein [Candidatus Desantisbacteria bacterium]|nr:ABC transporter ATP-binding protein [Candidatus Desantisbacteria bacterium]